MHPKVKTFYEQNQQLDYVKTVSDNLEEKFNEQVSTDIKSTVERMYRVKLGGIRSSEYLWYDQKDSGRDNAGNEISIIRTVGKYNMPHAQYRFDGANKKELLGIADVTTEYDIPWSPKLVDELEEKGMITEKTQVAIQTSSMSYGPFPLESFKSNEFEDLSFLGQNRRYPTLEEKQILTGKKVSK